MNQKNKNRAKLSRFAFIVCVLAVVFTLGSIFTATQMRNTSQMIYDYPYTVSNNARAMRSRLLDMKRFVSSFLIHDYVSEGRTNALFQERYQIQNEAIDAISQLYRGPEEDIRLLREAFDELIECQDAAVDFVPAHTSEQIDAYIEVTVYPQYDKVERCLDTIIAFADSQILNMTRQSRTASGVFIGMAVFLCAVIVLLTVYSSRTERGSIAALQKREKELEDALLLAQQASNAKKDFLSRMSHEIRTPMNVIIGMTTIAGSYSNEPRRVEDCLAKIAYSSRHLLALVNDVLDMSKIEEGKLLVSHDPFELQHLMESVLAIIRPQSKDKGQNFECDIKGTVMERYVGDFMRVNQVLLNILSNAIKFTPQDGTIRFTVEQLPEKNGRAYLRFVISDTGIGMSEEFLEKLFHPFEQETTQTASKYGGTGLGMAISYNLVELLGGSIQVTSQPGKGTTFTVDLPFDLPQDLVKPRQWTLDVLNVLVVDDDEDACTHASLLLERMGIQAQWVRSGYEAVQLVFDAHDSCQDFDVCLVDWKMPEMDGVEVTRRIRQRLGPDTIIIIISAYDWSEIEMEARQAGANAFIAKPLFESTLYNVLQAAFGAQVVREETDQAHVGAYAGKRFLLVEDNELNREIATEMLRETLAEIECAVHGQQAVEKFLSQPQGYYDAIFMDLQMPVMDGYEATRQIRAAEHPDAGRVPIFAMTANAFHEDVEKCLAAGMNGHIAKPIDTKLVFELLDNL